MKHFMKQHQHERAHYSFHACGQGDMRSGKESTCDWEEVNCPDCLKHKPKGLNHTKTIRLKVESISCSCSSDAGCDCDSFPGCAVQLDGSGGFGSGQWVQEPGSSEEVFQMRTLWGDFSAKDIHAAGEELARRVRYLNPDIQVHVF